VPASSVLRVEEQLLCSVHNNVGREGDPTQSPTGLVARLPNPYPSYSCWVRRTAHEEHVATLETTDFDLCDDLAIASTDCPHLIQKYEFTREGDRLRG